MSGERRRVIDWLPPAPPPAVWSGLEGVQAVADGRLPAPPFAALYGLSVSHAEAGLVRMALEPGEFHYNPMGTVHGGVAATLLETALAAAIRTILPAGRTCLTVEMKVNYVRALTVATGPVTAAASVVHAGRQVALAEGRVVDAGGRLYATASSTCLVMDAIEPPPPPGPMERRRVITWNDPLAGARRLSRLAGLEALQNGDFAPAIAALLGLQLGAAERGCMQMTLLPGEHLFSQFGAVHGGVAATLLDSVMGCAVHTTLPAGRGFTTLELKMSFLRPMTGASGLLTGTGQVVHEGRQMVTAEAKMVDAAGRLCATATTTCLVFDIPPAA